MPQVKIETRKMLSGLKITYNLLTIDSSISKIKANIIKNI